LGSRLAWFIANSDNEIKFQKEITPEEANLSETSQILGYFRFRII
jgi:hypothetical protein